MATLGTHWERDNLGGGFVQHTQYLRCVNYRDDNGNLRRNDDNWEDSGIPGRPHIITKAPFLVSAGQDGMRRIHPTRELDRYFEIGAPYVKMGGVWKQVNLGKPTRKGNLLKWTKPLANMYVRMAGHYIKLGILLKGGWVPQDRMIAFPVGLHGLTRKGTQILRDGLRVMHMRPAHVQDLDNPDDIRPVAHKFVNIGGQRYVLLTLPDLAGMTKPLIDPTLALQPDAADGMDTKIATNQPNTNYGTAANLFIGELDGFVSVQRTLINFNLDALPPNAIISSVILSLFARIDYSLNARTYRVYRQKRAWVEGTSQDPATTGATWNNYETSTPSAWQTAGGFGANDCEQTDIGSRVMTATEALDEFKDWPLTPTTKAGLDFGYGWLMKADVENNDGYSLASSDYATPANRPKLVFVYTLPASGMIRAPGWGRW